MTKPLPDPAWLPEAQRLHAQGERLFEIGLRLGVCRHKVRWYVRRDEWRRRRKEQEEKRRLLAPDVPTGLQVPRYNLVKLHKYKEQRLPDTRRQTAVNLLAREFAAGRITLEGFLHNLRREYMTKHA